MNTRRIILADSELKYIIKLQVKFLQELQDSYEIDVVSDRKYFEDCFSSPQNADCLIVNKNWLSSSLLKHNIDHIVVLTDGTTGDINASSVKAYIPRYTSTEEIYNQVRSMLVTEPSQERKKEASAVLFTSASGGTGKTVLSLSLAEHLSSRYYRVLYVNTQSAQSFQYYLTDRTVISTEAAMALAEDNDAYRVLRKQIRENGFSYLPPFAMPLFSYGIKHDIYTSFIIGARESGEFDYVIVDAGSDLTESAAEQITMADKVVMVVKADIEYCFALKQLLNKISVNDDKNIILCNRVTQNPVKEKFGDSLEISECVSEWRKGIDAETIHEFSKTDDVHKLAVLIG